MINLRETIKSRLDSTVKYIFTTEDRQVIEVASIDKNDGKRILCVPTQHLCSMGCKMCHMTHWMKQYPRLLCAENLTGEDLVEAIDSTLQQAPMFQDPTSKPLLISFMGVGEPLLNVDALVEVMHSVPFLAKMRPCPCGHDNCDCLRTDYEYPPKRTRFALSTMMPANSFKAFAGMAQKVKAGGFNLKVHFSLHFTDDATRNNFMPSAERIQPCLDMLQWYHSYTGNAVEIHYAPMEGVNDANINISLLGDLLKKGMVLKFLRYAPKPGDTIKGSTPERIQNMRDILANTFHIKTEYYEPPGQDIGAGCGQFLPEVYSKYIEKRCWSCGCVLQGLNESITSKFCNTCLATEDCIEEIVEQRILHQPPLPIRTI